MFYQTEYTDLFGPSWSDLRQFDDDDIPFACRDCTNKPVGFDPCTTEYQRAVGIEKCRLKFLEVSHSLYNSLFLRDLITFSYFIVSKAGNTHIFEEDRTINKQLTHLL